MTSDTVSATEQLDDLHEFARGARDHVAVLENKQRQTSRLVAQAEGRLADYFEALATGERFADSDLEQRLASELREVQETIATRVVTVGDRFSHVEAYSVRLEGELRGARRVLANAEREVEAFTRTNITALVLERLPDAERAATRLTNAARETGGAWQEWNSVYAEIARLGVPVEDMPDSPLGDDRIGLSQRIANITLAARDAPERLVPAPGWAVEAAREQ